MTTSGEIFNKLTPDMQQMISQAGQIILNTGLFVDVAISGDEKNVKVFAKPRWIYEDMIENDISPGDFNYAIQIPRVYTTMSTKDIMEGSTQIAKVFLHRYLKGTRKEIYDTKQYVETENVDNSRD